MAASRKLYVAMAQTIAYRYKNADLAEQETIRGLVVDLCGDLKQDNMSFNRDTFMTACGLS
jgi:hypothetical protein